MRTEFIADWVAALRSDQYQQGQQQLRQPSQGEVFHCCLGVACEVGIRYGVVKRNGNAYAAVGDAVPGDWDVNDWNSATLPYGFWQWIGFSGPDPRPGEDGENEPSLTSLNDESNATFAEIAQAIEETWLKASFT